MPHFPLPQNSDLCFSMWTWGVVVFKIETINEKKTKASCLNKK